MKITKYVHSCLLVETPERVALFDPGAMSVEALDVNGLEKLDDIFITHGHPDHMDEELAKSLVEKFPNVSITGPDQVVQKLQEAGIQASNEAPDGVTFFESPHEPVEPVFWQPEQRGIHYLNILSDPGDSHSFKETKTILALPITGPWGSTVKAVNLALQLKPQHILPIHDWHWSEAARTQMYNNLEKLFEGKGITFHKLETGQPVDIAV